MNLEGILLSKISQDGGRQILHALSYVWNLKKKKKKGKQNHRDRTNECLAEGWGVGKIGVGDEEL